MWQWTSLFPFILVLGLTFRLCWSVCLLPEGKGLVCKCFSEGSKVSCKRLMSTGTIVELSCNDYYKNMSLTKIKCKDEGIWTGESITCSPDCGSSNLSEVSIITHGQPTNREDWPWHATIYLRKNGKWTFLCGGSLIRDDTVLTAAHCVYNMDTSQPLDNGEILVVLGKHFREKNVPEADSQSKQVRRISAHPDFNPRSYENDLALIFLTSFVDITRYVRTVCYQMNEKNELQEDSMGVVVVSGKKKTGDLPQLATLNYIPEETCREKFPREAKDLLRPTTFCASSITDMNVCDGDSGSGMIFLSGPPGDQRWFVHGLVSGRLGPKYTASLPCNPKVAFLTRISSFADWIEDEMSQDEESSANVKTNMVAMIQSVVSQILESRLQSLDETIQQIMLKEEETGNEVNEIKSFQEQQEKDFQTQINDMEEELNIEVSLLKDLIAARLNTFEEKVNEIDASMSNNFDIANNQLNDVENEIQILQTGQTGLQGEINVTRQDVTVLIEDKCDGKETPIFSNCAELQQSGHNTNGIYDVTVSSGSLKVYCDFESDGGGWTVIQRRDDVTPHIDFNRNWEKYKAGFGDLQQEFWLGLNAIHLLTSEQNMSLLVNLEAWDGEKKFAQYERFSVENEEEKYRLSIGGYSGDAGDSLTKHGGQPFSTNDQDNDLHPREHCAKRLQSGWWFRACLASNLNGLYINGEHLNYFQGILWYTWKRDNYSLKRSEMKIRPVDFEK